MDTTQLLKGVLDLAVLAVVGVVGEWDGYDVVRRLREAGLADVGDASGYGTLRRPARGTDRPEPAPPRPSLRLPRRRRARAPGRVRWRPHRGPSPAPTG